MIDNKYWTGSLTSDAELCTLSSGVDLMVLGTHEHSTRHPVPLGRNCPSVTCTTLTADTERERESKYERNDGTDTLHGMTSDEGPSLYSHRPLARIACRWFVGDIS